MELEQLRFFRQIAEAGSVSRAAVLLGVSQSAASRQIKALESELRTRLFYRHGRGVALTDEGRYLFLAVKPLLEQLKQVKDVLLEESDEPTGPVIVGMPSSLMSTLGASVAQHFMEQYPKATLQLYEGSSGLLLERLEGGQIGAAVLYESRRGPNMVVTPLLVEQLFLVDAWRDKAEEGGELTWKELSQCKLILPGIQSGLRRAIETAADETRSPLRIVMDMHSVTVIKQLVEKGIARAILPYGAVHREVTDRYLSIRPIPYELICARLVTATATGQPLTRAMDAFLTLLNQEVRRCLESGILRGRAADPK